MAKTTKTLAEKVITATRRAQTKTALAESLGVSYTYISGVVNALVAEGTLSKTEGKSQGTRGRPADLYRRVTA